MFYRRSTTTSVCCPISNLISQQQHFLRRVQNDQTGSGAHTGPRSIRIWRSCHGGEAAGVCKCPLTSY